VIQRREQRGCGNTAGGSAQDRPVRSRRCDPHLPVCVHPSPRTSPRRELIVRVLNSRLRRALQCERLSATASKPRWTWRERFLSGSSPPRCARIATTPDTAHPAHRAAIVEGERDKCGGTPSRPLATGFECDISPTTSRLQFPCGRQTAPSLVFLFRTTDSGCTTARITVSVEPLLKSRSTFQFRMCT